MTCANKNDELLALNGFYPLVVFYALLSLVLFATFGTYQPWAVMVLLVLIVPLILIHCPPSRAAQRGILPLVILAGCLCFFSLIIWRYNSIMYIDNPHYNRRITQCGLFAFLMSIGICTGVLFSRSRPPTRMMSACMMICAAVLIGAKILVLFASPRPYIDVYYMLQKASETLIAGHNPYRASYTQIYPAGTSYAPQLFYFPLCVAILAPFRALCGDIRAGYIVCDCVFVLLICRIARRACGDSAGGSARLAAYLLGLVYLANPISFFVLEQSWTEPISALLLALSLYLLTRGSHLPGTSALGFSIASKQYNIVLIPFVSLLRGGGKMILPVILIALVTVLPFLLASPREFIASTVLHHLGLAPQAHALNVYSLLFNRYRIRIPELVSWPLLGAVFVSLLRRKDRGAAAFLRASITFSFIALLILKNVFCNYYYWISTQTVLLMLVYLLPGGDEL